MYKIDDIAVIILNWNGKSLLEQFLPSVVQFSDKAKIYLVDNASTDDSLGFIKAHFPSVSFIRNAGNYGYAKGYNEAIKYISEPILCLLNNDVEVTKHWLEPILEMYNEGPNAAIVQPKILDYKDKSRFEYAGAAGGYLDKYGYPFCRGRIFNALETDEGQYNDTRDILWASGACFFITKKCFEFLGGFDESYFAHMEEIDLCWRAFNYEFKAIYVGHSEVYHVGGASLANNNPQKTYLNFRNSLYTLVKNTDKPIFGKVLIRLILDGVAGLRFLLQLKPLHFFAILRAHGQFYLRLREFISKRKTLKQKHGYYKLNSIVWQYFILGRCKF